MQKIDFSDIKSGDVVRRVTVETTETGDDKTTWKRVDEFTVTASAEGLIGSTGGVAYNNTFGEPDWFLIDRPIPVPKNGDILANGSGDGVTHYVYLNGYLLRDVSYWADGTKDKHGQTWFTRWEDVKSDYEIISE